jgi:dTMP kinase
VLAQLERWVQEGLQPDLTLWFDLDPVLALRRVADARQADRFEAQDLAFFERVRTGYRARLEADPKRFARLDAARDRNAVSAQIIATLEARGW